MFSQLGPLFKTHLRQAERTDTRLEIRREDEQDQGKKREEEAAEDTNSVLWEDSTTVSVEALKAFLIEFLKSRGDDVPEAPTPTDELALQPHPEYRPPANPRTARAVQAYSSTAAHAPPPPPATAALEEKSQDSAATEARVDLVSLLAADEIRTMHVLITELDALHRGGVQTLVIEKAGTFLEALVLAVRAEKLKT